LWQDCHKTAVIKIRHTGMALCKDHFLRNVEDRVEKALLRHHMLSSRPTKRERWVVAMSGGKDSQALAEVLRKKFPAGDASPVELIGLYIDVHVHGNGYTDESRTVVQQTCERLQMPCHVVDVRGRYGITMDDLHVVSQCKRGGHRTECSACGIMKRYLINRAAAELNADKVATGHHLTDEATNILSNFLAMNLEQMGRPHPWERRAVVTSREQMPPPEAIAATGTGLGTGDVGVLIPRVKPFIEVTEEETTMYVHYAGIPHVATQCPYSAGAASSALKKHMLAIEKERPGTMLILVRGFNKLLLPIIRQAKHGTTSTTTTTAAAAAVAPDPEETLVTEAEEAPTAPTAEAEEAAQASSTDVQLVACTRCGCPTIVPVCAWCKLVEQAKQFKEENPWLFEAAEPRCHQCEVCCPGGTSKPTPGNEIEEVSLTTDMKSRSKKRMRRESRGQRDRRAVAATNAPTATAPTSAPAPAPTTSS